MVEQEAGVAELDSDGPRLVWETIGGEQRAATGFADALVEDDVAAIGAAESGPRSTPECPRSTAGPGGRWMPPGRDRSIRTLDGPTLRALGGTVGKGMSRGRTWFEALAGANPGGRARVRAVRTGLSDGDRARFLAVVPNPDAKFPRARHGELGLEEGWALARRVREAVWTTTGRPAGPRRRRRCAGQPYGYREELLGLHLALAAAVDAYATARLAGHPVVALVVGQAISGAFLAHGMQANRILALDDPGVAVQVMSKRSTARVTRRSVEELDEIAKEVPATAFDIASFARLGALHRLIDGVDAAEPDAEDVETVRDALAEAIFSARHDGSTDLSGRFASPEARQYRDASLRVRERLAEEWSE